MTMHQLQYHEELKKELEGTQYTPVATESKKNTNEKDTTDDYSLEQVAKDEDNISMVTMSRKKRRLYEAMKVSIHLYQLTTYPFFKLQKMRW